MPAERDARYCAHFCALDAAGLSLPPGAPAGAVRAAMHGHELARAELKAGFPERDARR